MSVDKKELRREKRVPGKHSIVVCYQSQDGSNKEMKHTCRTEDISEGGVKVVIRRPLRLGSVLPIEIKVIDEGKQFYFNGEVKWCLEIDEAPTYFAGIKLSKIEDYRYQEWRAIANDK